MAKLYNLAGMSTATTGTGTITLGSAMYGHLTFAQAGVVDGDTVTYAIKDGANSEIGRGVYTSSGTTLTRTVLKSTNSDAAINLSGTAEVVITALAEDIIEPPSSSVDSEIMLYSGTSGRVAKRASTTGILKATSGVLAAATAGTDYVAPSAVREKLTAARTYYVRTDGSNSNTGLTNTSGGAFLTLQKAWDVIAGTLDLGGQTVTIKAADGTYNGTLNFSGGWTGGGQVIIEGNVTTPANAILSSGGSNYTLNCDRPSPGTLTVKGFKLTSSFFGSIGAFAACKLVLDKIEFGSTGFCHIGAFAPGAFVTMIYGTITITGGAGQFASVENGAFVELSNATFTLTGTPAFTEFAKAISGGIIRASGASFSGAATGAYYNVSRGGIIDTNGAGASFFPGNSAGSGTGYY